MDQRGYGWREFARLMWARVRPVDDWHSRHPLPTGFRARTRVTTLGRVVEPWSFVVLDDRSRPVDGGERWLDQGHEADQAAWQIARWWRTERPGVGDAGWLVLARPGWATRQGGGTARLERPLPQGQLAG